MPKTAEKNPFTFAGFVPETKIRAAVGLTPKNENEARRRSGVGYARAFTAVSTSSIDRERTVPRGENEPDFLAVGEALNVLPGAYRPLTDEDGNVRAAAKFVRKTEVRGYLADEVEALRAAVAQIADETEQKAAAKQAETAARRAAWVRGDVGVYLTRQDLIEAVTPANARTLDAAAGIVVGRQAPLPPGAVVLPAVEVSALNPITNSFEPVDSAPFAGI